MFGHDPLSWTPIRGLGVETTVFHAWPFGGDDNGDDDNADCPQGQHKVFVVGFPPWECVADEDDDNGDFFDWDKIIPVGIKQIFKKVKGAVTKAWVYATGEDVAISQTEVIWCCPNGTQKKVVYGLYKVDSKKTAKGGPRTVDGVSYLKDEKYAKLQYWESSGPFYQDGYQRLKWDSKPGIARFKVDALSDVPVGPRWEADTDGDGGDDTATVVGEDEGMDVQETFLPLTAQDMFDKFVEGVDGDGSCDSQAKRGCMNPVAGNYQGWATCSDGSCRCGEDQAGRPKKFNNTGTECIVTPCTIANHKKNTDGSCGTSCNDGFVFKKGVYPKQCVVPPVDCKVSAYSAWSACSPDGIKTRTRTITVQPEHGGQVCGRKYGGKFDPQTKTYSPPVLSQTQSCTYTPPPADDEDEDEDTDITTQTTTVEVVEEETSMMPWIIGGAVVLGIGVYAMKK